MIEWITDHLKFELATMLVGTTIALTLRQRIAKMLEGKELEGKIGTVGGYSLDVDAKGFVKVEALGSIEGVKASSAIELDVIVVLRMLAKKTENKLDDSAVDMIASALGR